MGKKDLILDSARFGASASLPAECILGTSSRTLIAGGRRFCMCFIPLLVVAFAAALSGCGATQVTKRLVSVAITPRTTNIALGTHLQFSAAALFSDGSETDITNTAEWISAQPNVASVDAAGMVTSKGVGSTPISALYQSMSASSTLTVASAALVSIAVTPRSPSLTPNHSIQLIATGRFTDGSTQDLSSTVAWLSTPTGTLTISSTGLATANLPGEVRVTAIQEKITGSDKLMVTLPTLVSIALSPQNISLTPSHSAQLKATGTYSDGSTQDISASVTWDASPNSIVAISDKGLATGKALGAATITTVSAGVSATDAIAVVAPTLESILIAPSGAVIPVGISQQLSAIGKYNDGSTKNLTSSVQWSSSKLTVLGIDSQGMATANALGTVTVTAMSGTVTATNQLQVGPPIVMSVAVRPTTSFLYVGGSEQLSALAKFSDGSIRDMTTSVSWSSADSTIARISDQGFLLASHVGDTTISVSLDTVGGSAGVSVKPVMAVSYFSNANTSGLSDATVRLTNPGVTGGNVCAEIYVFDQDQQLSECCGCLVSPDGLQTLSVNTNLTANPLTGIRSTTGVVKIVPANASVNPSCDPTAIAPAASVAAWSTHIQKRGASAFAITETPFQLGPLGDDELAGLQSQCSFSSSLGSGQGVCTCGTVPSSVTGAAR